MTFCNLIGRDEAGLSTNQLGDRLRATEGCFMMTDIADVESVVETAVAGKVISSCHWGNLLVNNNNGTCKTAKLRVAGNEESVPYLIPW